MAKKYIHTDRQTDRQTDRHADKQTDRQTDITDVKIFFHISEEVRSAGILLEIVCHFFMNWSNISFFPFRWKNHFVSMI